MLHQPFEKIFSHHFELFHLLSFHILIISEGEKDRSSSDNPEKAIISLKNDRETDYKVYISVQNELVAAYNELRDREFTKKFPNDRMSFVEANKMYSDPRTSVKVKTSLKPKLDEIKKMFPQKLSEAEPNKK